MLNRGGLLGFDGLSPEIVTELIVRVYGQTDLSQMEQLVFGFRYKIIDAEDTEKLMGPSDIAEQILLYTGVRLTEDTVMSIVEKSEAKVGAAIWRLIEKLLRDYLL